MIHPWSIARRLFVANLLIVVVFLAVVGSATFVDARDRTYDEAGQRMAGIAAAIAASPLVLEAASSPDPTTTLQPYARDVMAGADVDFVTIMAPDRTRWTHPRDEEIGRPYIGSIDAALQGGQLTEVTAGTLGPSVRTIVPVKDEAGEVKALVAVGVGDVDPLPGQAEVVGAVSGAGTIAAGPFVEPTAHPESVPDLGFGGAVVPAW